MKKYLGTFSLLLFIVLSTVSFAQDMPPDAAKAYNEGNKFLKAGNYEAAVQQYRDALKLTQDYRIYYQLGITLKKESKLEDAISAFQSAIQNKPDFDIAYNGLGSTYFQLGKYEESVDAFKKFKDMTKKSSQKAKAGENLSLALVKLAEVTKKDGNQKKAIEYLDDAIADYPTDAAYILLVTTYYELGEYDNALTKADEALNMKNFKMKGAAYYYKGMALKQKKILDKAKENFELALKDPQYKRLAQYELKLMQ